MISALASTVAERLLTLVACTPLEKDKCKQAAPMAGSLTSPVRTRTLTATGQCR